MIIMRELKNVSLTFLTLLLLFTTSCSTDDEPSHEIKYLTGYQKKEAGISSIECDGKTLIAEKVLGVSESNATLIALIFSDQNVMNIRFFDEDNLSDNQLVLILDNIQYTGEDFNVEEVDDHSFIISGDLSSDAFSVKPIVINFDENSLGAGNSTITVNGNVAEINGTLGALMYNQILDLNRDERNVHTLLLNIVPGSINDEVNEETGRLIREAGYTTWVKSTSVVESGGVDLFCAGKKRIVDNGAILGVHSWCCGTNGEDAFEIPVNDQQHTRPKAYLIEMLGEPFGTDFYFFAINAASADDIHNMTKAEIEKYHLKTK